MISARMEQALNEQMNAEFFSFYLYLSVSAFFNTQHLDGFAHWMEVQASEELAHAMKLFEFVNDRGGTVRLGAIDAPQSSWDSPTEAVEAVLHHEQYITDRIDKAVTLANEEHDHASTVLLHWFVNEQVEEVATADTLCNQVKMLESSPHGLLMLDRELAGRQAAPAATE